MDPDDPKDYILADVAYTAGTTSGRPTPIYQTSHDLRGLLLAQLRMARIRGMREGDRVANLYPLAPYPHGGWLRPTQASAVLGAPVVSATSGFDDGRYPITRSTSEVVDLVVKTQPTVVWGVPSYVAFVLGRIAEQGGSIPDLRMIAVSGEPCTATRRKSLQNQALALGADDVIISDSLGASELQFSLVECPGGGGFHNPAPELVYIEVVDDAGSAVGDGQPGRLTYTHLDRTGTVLLRYLVGDRVVLDRSRCKECGWFGARIVEHHGREDSFVKIRGMLMHLGTAHSLVERLDGVSDHRIRVSSSPDGMDVLELEVVLGDVSNEEARTAAIADEFRESMGIRPQVSAVSPTRIWSPEQQMKPQRFVDTREVK